MSDVYLGYTLFNLIVPEDPATFQLRTAAGHWDFKQNRKYPQWKDAILKGSSCEITYDISTEVTVTNSRAAAMAAAYKELLPICLGASYLTGMTVRPVQGHLMSEVEFFFGGDHFPRERAMVPGWPMASSQADFTADLETFVPAYLAVERSEKARLLIHHWLDTLACWSLEDLTLGTATILEIIKTTAKDISISSGSGKGKDSFARWINCAADRLRLPHLPSNFRKMRNDLVHEGRLSGSHFPNKSDADCCEVVAEALSWIDQYLHAIFGLGQPRRTRFDKNTFQGLNAFSFD